MTYFADTEKTIGLEMASWTGCSYGPSWEYDFFDVGRLEKDEAKSAAVGKPVYKVEDVEYLIEQASGQKRGTEVFVIPVP